MCNMCAMMTEIYTIEGGKKDVSSPEGTTLKKTFLKIIYFTSLGPGCCDAF